MGPWTAAPKILILSARRVDGLNLRGRQLNELAGGVVVHDDALLQELGGDGARHNRRTGIAAALVVGKEECPVFLDGPVDRRAEDIDIQRRNRHAGAIAEKVVGRGFGAAPVFIHGPVEIVGAGVRHQRNIGAGCAALGGVPIRRRAAALRHRIGSHSEHAGERGPGALIVHINAVQRDVALIAPAAVHGTVAIVDVGGVVVAGGVVVGAEIRDARLELQQVGHVAGEGGQLDDGLLDNRIAERGIRRIELCRVRLHRDRGGGGSELIEDYRLGAWLVNVQAHVVYREIREASRLGGQLVGAGRQLLHRVAPLGIGLVFALQAGFRVDDGNDRARYYRARRIRDRSRKGRRLPKQTRGKRYGERQYTNQFFHL